MSYNNGRSIGSKSDVGTYSYGANGAPLTSINRVSGYNPSAQSITYNSSNLPASITQGGYTRTYTYDVNDQRDYSVLTKSNTTLPFAASKRYYFGDFERNINTENNTITDLDYIFANGRLVALIKTVGTTKTAYGVLTDRQGSLRALYNGSGLVQSFSYDAWGNRRNPSTGVALTTSELVAANSITNRGYTCHEHMDEFGLINMNARIYDPSLGLFISVDPLAQDYYDTYPYAYCGGDPVNAVDPTGESTWWTTDNPEEIASFWEWLSQNGGGSTGSYDFRNASWNSFSFDDYIEAIENGKGLTHLIHDMESIENNWLNTIESVSSWSSMSINTIGDYAEYSGATYRLYDETGKFAPFIYRDGWKGSIFTETYQLSEFSGVLYNIARKLDYIGLGINIYQLFKSPNIENRIEITEDLIYSGLGYVPAVGTGISLYWSTIGKPLQNMYKTNVLIPLLKTNNGILYPSQLPAKY